MLLLYRHGNIPNTEEYKHLPKHIMSVKWKYIYQPEKKEPGNKSSFERKKEFTLSLQLKTYGNVLNTRTSPRHPGFVAMLASFDDILTETLEAHDDNELTLRRLSSYPPLSAFFISRSQCKFRGVWQGEGPKVKDRAGDEGWLMGFTELYHIRRHFTARNTDRDWAGCITPKMDRQLHVQDGRSQTKGWGVCFQLNAPKKKKNESK